MLKMERKLLEWIEKHMFVLILLVVSILALYIRRLPIWWNPETIGAYFDWHENSVQSFLYYLLLQGVQYLPMLPVHSIKWISVIGDFGTAALCLLLVREYNKDNGLLSVFCYSMCLFSPVLILRGCVWAQIDSLAVMFFLLGQLFWEKDKRLLAAVFALLSALLYPCMLVFVFLHLWGSGVGKRGAESAASAGLAPALWALGFLAVWLLGCGFTALPLGRGFAEGIKNGFAWLSYDPVSGKGFMTGLDWIMEMLVNLGLAGSVTGGLALVRRGRFPLFAVLCVHFFIAALYGSRLFPG